MARRAPPARKSIFDPVHGVITIRGAALDLIGLPAFQRLWGIRQTGFAHLVFPGANHTRLEHSLGVYAVARALAEPLALDPGQTAAVTSGALLHDLGHGPLSHTLDPSMHEVLGFSHERISRDWIVGKRTAEGLDPERRAPSIPEVLERHSVAPGEVADLVDPPHGRERQPLLRAVLHGAIDADRIDYLLRDAHYTGVAHGAIDAVRLLDTARAHRGRLAFEEKGRSAVEGFLVGRALMYSSVYYHKTVRAAEVMAQAAVERAPGYPGQAGAWFDGTDAELLLQLVRAGGTPERLTRSLLLRRLYKRAHGWRALPSGPARWFRRLAKDPEWRRAVEEELADRLGGPPASVLFDLSGLDRRTAPDADWDEVALLEEGKVTHPFRGSDLLRALAGRPTSTWSVAVYVAPRLLPAARRSRARALDRMI